VALTFKLTSQSITQRAFGLPKDTLDPFMAEAGGMPYDIPNTQYDLVIHDSGLRVGYWRSVSHALNAFANESFCRRNGAGRGQGPVCLPHVAAGQAAALCQCAQDGGGQVRLGHAGAGRP
jgi:isoquinoline 1-oxidoreductase beta subunit